MPVGNTQTVVAADGTFNVTFEIDGEGRIGYSFVADTPPVGDRSTSSNFS